MGAGGLGEGHALSQKQQEGPARFTPKKDMGRWQSGRTKGRGGDFSAVLGAATMARMRSGEWRGGNTPRDKAASASLNSLLSEPPRKPLKNLPASAGDGERCGCDPWVGKIPWRRACQPAPVFLLETPLDREASRATVNGVAKSQTGLSNLARTTHP